MYATALSVCIFAILQVSLCNEERKVACEGKSITINCSGKNARIDITDALYGRKTKNICYKFYHGVWNKNCKSSKSLSETRKKCQGKKSCTVKAKNSVFGDPCFMTEKYLEVKYICRVDGGFSAWSNYGECTKSCGGGVMSRSRSCTNPAPKNGGNDCSGAKEESKACNEHPCPVNGGYSKWSEYDGCTASCGGGVQSRSRECNNPAPAHGGKDCSELGAAHESRQCNTHPCPVNGGYSKWSEYEECTASCGGGVQSRSRECNNPAPAHGGKDCSELGAAHESRQCNAHPCPVNGGYSKWSEYEECTASCGGGIQSRSRECNNPAPAHGGKDCSELGAAHESRQCNAHPCPVNGGYSKWSEYEECTASCGGGVQSRSRECNNPAPAHGGKDCSELGAAHESRQCNAHPCPVNGGYSKWSEYEECTASCGGGVQSRSRECNNPAPAHGGKDCSELGAAHESRQCNAHPCPVNGGYSKWSEYEECTASCGGGVQSRSRACDNPAPAHGGKDCSELGPDHETRQCNTHPCPVNGGYSTWSEYEACSASCGGGAQSRSRECNNPAPAHGGKDCSELGAAHESRQCNTQACPVPISAEMKKTVCEGSTNEVKCSGDAKIMITGAIYGRKDKNTCSDWYNIHWSTTCQASKSLSVVKEKCEGKSSCSVKADNGVFGDPCWMTRKYLTISFKCRG